MERNRCALASAAANWRNNGGRLIRRSEAIKEGIREGHGRAVVVGYNQHGAFDDSLCDSVCRAPVYATVRLIAAVAKKHPARRTIYYVVAIYRLSSASSLQTDTFFVYTVYLQVK